MVVFYHPFRVRVRETQCVSVIRLSFSLIERVGKQFECSEVF